MLQQEFPRARNWGLCFGYYIAMILLMILNLRFCFLLMILAALCQALTQQKLQ